MNQEKITKLHNKFLIETYTNLDPARLADLLEFSKIYNAKFIEKSDKKGLCCTNLSLKAYSTI
ncbi:hypothetical protein U2T26_18325 [Acinetobacter baumannii]|nr:hypothetical protein [Acinetobacter baumannii]